MMYKSPYYQVTYGLKSRSKGKKNTELLSLLQFDWPVSRYILEKISECFSCESNLEDEQIYQIIEKALSRYGETVYFKNGEKMPDPMRFAVFLESLISEAASTLGIDVLAKSYIEVNAITDLVVISKEGDSSPGEDTNKEMIRDSLFNLITSHKVKNVLRRAKYENTLMADS
ncbi:hypothetical protein J9B83_12925 [Marinomonas sp. A79]|uniref:Uncharacterized protein n=2 Tax=Marinomonas vulgaris TaxID=2823372 RepID=A0ABS5HDY3_9GAMM|nr:hypothetical protein [Marinomonas vulgaris]